MFFSLLLLAFAQPTVLAYPRSTTVVAREFDTVLGRRHVSENHPTQSRGFDDHDLGTSGKTSPALIDQVFQRVTNQRQIVEPDTGNIHIDLYRKTEKPGVSVRSDIENWGDYQCRSYLVRGKLLVHGNLSVNGRIHVLSSTDLTTYETFELEQSHELKKARTRIVKHSLDKFSLELCHKSVEEIYGDLNLPAANLIIGGGQLVVTGSIRSQLGIDVDEAGELHAGISTDAVSFINSAATFFKLKSGPSPRCISRGVASVAVESGVFIVRNSSKFIILGDVYTKVLVVDRASTFEQYCGTLTVPSFATAIVKGVDTAVLSASHMSMYAVDSEFENLAIEGYGSCSAVGEIRSAEAITVSDHGTLDVIGNLAGKLLIVKHGGAVKATKRMSKNLSSIVSIVSLSEAVIMGTLARVDVGSHLQAPIIEISSGSKLNIQGDAFVDDYIIADAQSSVEVNGLTSVTNYISASNSTALNLKKTYIGNQLIVSRDSRAIFETLDFAGCTIVVKDQSSLSADNIAFQPADKCPATNVLISAQSQFASKQVSAAADELNAIKYLFLTDVQSSLEFSTASDLGILVAKSESTIRITHMSMKQTIEAVQVFDGSQVTLISESGITVNSIQAITGGNIVINANKFLFIGDMKVFNRSTAHLLTQNLKFTRRLETEEDSSTILVHESLILPPVFTTSIKSSVILAPRALNYCDSRFKQAKENGSAVIVVRDRSSLGIYSSVLNGTLLTADIHTKSRLVCMCDARNISVYVTEDSTTFFEGQAANLTPVILTLPPSASMLVSNVVAKMDVSNSKTWNETEAGPGAGDRNLKQSLWNFVKSTSEDYEGESIQQASEKLSNYSIKKLEGPMQDSYASRRKRKSE